MKRKLLIGTTNQGKFKEISSFLDTLPFELVSLNDLKESITEPEKTESTLEGNALLKARYYGDKTGLLTLTDDNQFLALYDPLNNSVFLADSKDLFRIKYHLQNTYSGKHIVVPCAIIIKDSKLLMALRNDPHRPEYHRKWEFPGGTVEFGENLEENIKREVKEESGYDIKVIKLLQNIAVESQQYPTHKYQIYLVPYVCQIIGGDGKYNDEEVLDVQWFDLDEVLKYELVGENATIYERIMPELKQVILENSL